MIPSFTSWITKFLCVPRECGDDPGIRLYQRCGIWVFPASAGMIRQSLVSLVPSESVPRECGDDPWTYSVTIVLGGVFPASAGMIPPRRKTPMDKTSVPRECGDDPWMDWGSAKFVQCSPRVRG